MSEPVYAPEPALPDEEILRLALQAGVERPSVEGPVPEAALPLEPTRLEALRAASSAEAESGAHGDALLTAAELELLADLGEAEAEVAEGRARAPSDAVLAAALGALAAPAAAATVLPTTPLEPAPPSSVPRAGATLRVLHGRGASHATRRWLGAAAALLLALLGGWWWNRLPEAARPAAGPSAAELASLQRTLGELETAPTPDAGPGRADRAAPFVEARLWRALVGRPLRGGEGLGLAQGAASADADPLAPDVLLAWRPDAVSEQAGRLRVHVRGPAGLVVRLPDLGVEGVLGEPTPSATSEAGSAARYVDLPLPAGWSSQLPSQELRLAFRWPRQTPQAATAAARFEGVSLDRRSVPEGS